MRFIVTGALGFIGSALIQKLPKSFPGCEMVLIDNLRTGRSASLSGIPETAYQFLEEDITHFDLAGILKPEDRVIHLAALTNTVESFEIPEDYHEVNTLGTQKVAEACANRHAKMILVSTTNVYGHWQGQLEEEALRESLRPENPYAVSKLEAEKYLEKISHQINGCHPREGVDPQTGFPTKAFGNDIQKTPFAFTVLRFGTVFGASSGVTFHTAINKFCKQAANHQPITVWKTALDQIRPYLYLRDAVDAIVFVLKNDLFSGQTYNLATTSVTIRVILKAISLYASDLTVQFVESKTMNDSSYRVGPSRLEGSGFQIRGSLVEGIAEIFAFLKPLASL